jgi:hypothetical protein
MIKEYFPEEQQRKIELAARKNISQYYARIAHKIYKDTNNKQLALVLSKNAIRFHINYTSLIQATKLYFKTLLK